MRASRRARSAPLAVALALLAGGCLHASDQPGVPLYPHPDTERRPRDQIAQVFGPIAKIDGKDVGGQGGVFDLLPGCHLVELERRVVADRSLSGGIYWGGEFPITIYVLRMKAGARYVIKRQIFSEGSGTARLALSAREEQADGAATDLDPAKSAEDVRACKAWEAELGR